MSTTWGNVLRGCVYGDASALANDRCTSAGGGWRNGSGGYSKFITGESAADLRTCIDD